MITHPAHVALFLAPSIKVSNLMNSISIPWEVEKGSLIPQSKPQELVISNVDL
jgi:hypothetical protein